MRLAILFLTLLLAGCNMVPGLKMPESWKGLGGGSKTSGAVAAAEGNKTGVSQLNEMDKKVEEARKKMEQDYETFRKELADAYKKREEIDNKNFNEISKINFGILYATEAKKETDTDIAIAYFRAKENMFRLDPLSTSIQNQIKQEVDNDRKKTYGDILKKYDKLFEEAKAAADAYNKASELIKQKEEEKTRIRAENRSALDKLNADKNAEIERVQREAEDKLKAAKEAQRQEYIGYMVKALVGVGIIFLIIAGLMKSINLGIISISSFALAYTIATAPVWVIGTVVGLTVLSMVGVTIYSKTKDNKQATPLPVPAVVEAAPAPVRQLPRRLKKRR